MTDDVWTRPETESPCINLCVVHPETRLCMGCYRSLDEIAGWSRMSPRERRAVLADLPGRAPHAAPRRSGGRAARVAAARANPPADQT